MWRLDLIVTAELFYTSASFWNNLLGGHSAGKQSSELLFFDSPFLSMRMPPVTSQFLYLLYYKPGEPNKAVQTLEEKKKITFFFR